ncbi:DUF4350 domain-containing protein [Salinimicrobium soli]|uniref:DUF4350 domain-containing protein n=2 Tax=Bacteria TaxID=2 RepID=UPI003AB0AE79
MSKAYKFTLFLLVALLVLLTYLEASEPDEVNWRPSFAASDKIPLGAFVLYENLKEQDLETRSVNIPPFEFLTDSAPDGTYFFLNDQLNIDKSELKRLFQWIEKGNTAFLIANSFGKALIDTLDLKIKMEIPKTGISSKPLYNLSDPDLKRENAFLFDRNNYNFVISKYDSLQQEALGVTDLYKDTLRITDPYVNFLRDSIGKGLLYLHTAPEAFSNYFLLSEVGNEEYVERVLAYLPAGKTLYLDRYYKAGKAFNTSPLFVLLRNRQLRWAYYTLMIGSVLFLYFEGKRKQRSIPVIKPLRNQTYHFTRTVAGLYIDSKDYKSIATKKINLFLEYLRSRYRMNTTEVRESFFERLASVSTTPVEEVKDLWTLMDRLKRQDTVSKEELIQLNKAISAFKKYKDGK